MARPARTEHQEGNVVTAQRTDEAQRSMWERVPPPNRGRSAPLTPDEIARTALAVADAENLTAVSVKRVATRLRVPSPRLGQYLTSRDELYDLMLDYCLGEIALPDAGLGWRTQLEHLARETYRLTQEHRSLVELIGGRSPSGPNGLRFIEQALAAFEPTGLDVRTAALCFNAVLSLICGSAGVRTRHRSGPADQRRITGDADYLSQTVSAEMFPHLRALFADAPDLTSDESFDHGLGCLLDGIEARVRADASAAG